MSYRFDLSVYNLYTPKTYVKLFFSLCCLEKGDITPHRMDEKFLLRFLRARHFKLLPTYQLVSSFILKINPLLQTTYKQLLSSV